MLCKTGIGLNLKYLWITTCCEELLGSEAKVVPVPSSHFPDFDTLIPACACSTKCSLLPTT